MRLNGTARLTASQLREFHDQMLDAFDNPNRLDNMLKLQLGKNRARISMDTDLETVVLKIIEFAEARFWSAELLMAARAENPEHQGLLLFAEQFGLALAAPTGRQLERKIKLANAALDVMVWREGLAKVETCLCRVEIRFSGETIAGTGFLLGPSMVMTNFHVMERVIKGEIPSDRVKLRFDYKRLGAGSPANEGQLYSLAENDWLLDHSEYSPLDLEINPATEPAADLLDYALLRIAGTPGNDAVSIPRPPSDNAGDRTGQAAGGVARGWLTQMDDLHEFKPESALHILQHPEDQPLKLTLDTDSVIGVNASGTRVRYKTNTEHGSSGSPCFDTDWNLIALHHSGDPNYDAMHHPEYNQGIPFAAILKLMKQRGKDALLGT